MTSEKREMSDFSKFPGEIAGDIYKFPELFHSDEAGRLRVWRIQIRLIPRQTEYISAIDWELKSDQLPMLKKYLSQMMPDNIIAMMWVETGIAAGKITRVIPTYITAPTNVDRANERNVFQTALIMARTQWLLKISSGHSTSRTPIKKSTMYFPMLAVASEAHLMFPAYIQPKLDGVRCLIYLKKHGEPLSVTAYSRNRKPILSAGAICGRLYPYLNALYDTANKHSIYLDGELYIHGKSLQEISGNARQHLATDQQYHIYDCFYPDELQTPFADRLKQLQEIQRTLTQEDQQYIKFVDTRLINNRAEMLEQYRKFTSAKYEGAIVRNCLAPYLASSTKTSSALRSPDLIKIKPLFTDEFKCIGYTDGKRGRDAGAIIWQCMTANKIVFNVTPKLDYAERYRLFAECEEYTNQHGKFKYHDQPLTVEYQDLSKTGVPLRAKSVVFRTYE